MNDDHSSWLAQARELLDAQVKDQDYALRAQLTAVRQHVLAQRDAVARRTRWLLRRAVATASVSGLALAAYFTFAVVPAAVPPQAAELTAVAVDPATLLVASDELELYQDLDLYENLEFYAWLQSQPVGG